MCDTFEFGDIIEIRDRDGVNKGIFNMNSGDAKFIQVAVPGYGVGITARRRDARLIRKSCFLEKGQCAGERHPENFCVGDIVEIVGHKYISKGIFFDYEKDSPPIKARVFTGIGLIGYRVDVSSLKLIRRGNFNDE